MPMDNETLKEEAKSRLPELLSLYGSGKSAQFSLMRPKARFTCLNPGHDDRSPSMTYDSQARRFRCWSCGASGDSFDLVALCEGLKPGSRECFQRTYEILGLAEPSHKPQTASFLQVRKAAEEKLAAAQKTRAEAAERQKEANSREAEREVAIRNVIAEARRGLEGSTGASYLQERGIASETAQRLDLGFLRAFRFGRDRMPVLAEGKPFLVLPYSDSGAALRATDKDANPRYLNLGKKGLFNAAAFRRLWDRKSLSPVFVVEGEIDAASCEECGFPAVGMSSASNAALVVKALKDIKSVHSIQMPVILALDADAAGVAAQEKLAADLKQSGIKTVSSAVWQRLEAKDANDALVKSRARLEDALRDECLTAQGFSAADAAVFVSECGSESMYSRMLEEIEASKTRTSFSTGLETLDDALGGGLPIGLTVLGGDPSTGKTSLALQMSAHYAETGGYVIFVSLETGKLELFAKQVSRETYLKQRRERLPQYLAKDARSVLSGTRQAIMTREEREFIDGAAADFAFGAGRRVFVLGGVEQMTVEQICDEVRRAMFMLSADYKNHEDYTPPLVVVDYLQIVRASDDRMDNIRALDHIVSGLKRFSVNESVPVLLLAAFNRASVSYDEKDFSAFKGSSGIEYGADCVLGLSFNGDAKTGRKSPERDLKLTLMKQRLGVGRADIRLKFHAVYGAFDDCGLMTD